MDSGSGAPPAVPLTASSTLKFKIALCQLPVAADKGRNINQARVAIERAARGGAKLVILPEMWNCPYSNENFQGYAEDIVNGKSPSALMLSEVALLQQITIVGGSIPEWDGDLLYNTCCIFGSDGKLKARHRKLHLFDFEMPGLAYFKESDSLTAGNEPTVVNTDVGRIGIGICHDIRLPELAMLYKSRGAQIVCYPGAFNMSTGEALWELMQRARHRYLHAYISCNSCMNASPVFACRACDNQIFVAVCSPARDLSAKFVIWGHSTVVGPCGSVIATTGHDEALVTAEIDYSLIPPPTWSELNVAQRWHNLFQFIDIHDEQSEIACKSEEEENSDTAAIITGIPGQNSQITAATNLCTKINKSNNFVSFDKDIRVKLSFSPFAGNLIFECSQHIPRAGLRF